MIVKTPGLSSDFFARLRNKGIPYCHWKSNHHLEEGLIGNTDLDLLICQDHKEQFQKALSRSGFKRIIASTPKQYPGMEDYLGCDLPTGRLIHLHVHYKLILGQKYIKNHHLPIEHFVLENLEVKKGIFVPKKEIELFLLCIRATMKLGMKEVVQYFFGRLNSPFPEAILQEFRSLLDNAKPDDLRRVIHESGLPVSQRRLIRFTEKLRHDRLTLLEVFALRHHLFKVLRSFRRRHPIHCFAEGFFGRLHVLPGIKRVWPPPRKRLQKGGISFALVGADGSGKSTLVK
ncbi:MAG: hypothetical protein V2J25_09965, partial [Desulfatiglans sp.]|nr:hypothetical protein [Desulfatiglans sp.]